MAKEACECGGKGLRSRDCGRFLSSWVEISGAGFEAGSWDPHYSSEDERLWWCGEEKRQEGGLVLGAL